MITWSSDLSVTASGWKLCFSNVADTCEQIVQEWYDELCWYFQLTDVWCSHGLLPSVASQCHDVGCDNAVSTFDIIQFGGTCDAYCESQGLACEETWATD